MSQKEGQQPGTSNCVSYALVTPASRALTIPANVSVIKISLTVYPLNRVHCGLGWYDSQDDWDYETRWAYVTAANSTEASEGKFVWYVGVTPGKTYMLQYAAAWAGSSENGYDSDTITITYSASINNQTPDVLSY